MGRREWDSTNNNLSDMKYSPQQRKLKKEASLKATKAHRADSPRTQSQSKDTISQSKDNIIKKVNWKDWNLRESVDFESEIDNFVPVVQVGSFHSSMSSTTDQSSNDIPDPDKPKKDAIRHLKNVISNTISDNIESSNDIMENLEIDSDTSAMFIKYILQSKDKDQKRDSEISELKDLIFKLRREYNDTKDELDACQLIVSNHQRRIKELEVVVESQHEIIKDQANLLVDHMSSKEVLENIRKSMSGIRF